MLHEAPELVAHTCPKRHDGGPDILALAGEQGIGQSIIAALDAGDVELLDLPGLCLYP